jgi:glycine/betaine/sarcosine/D-proline reductase family selenoprotein B
MGDLSRGEREFLAAYQWTRVDPVPWATPRESLAEARIGLVTTACLTIPGQPRFYAERPGSDPSVRIIPSDTHATDLHNGSPHDVFDHSRVEADANILAPLDRLNEMDVAGEIGSLTPWAVSLCGHLPNPRRLVEHTAPEVARLFGDTRTDSVLIVASCPMSEQTACLVAAEIERQGIPTVVILYLHERAEQIRPPRAFCVPFSYGSALGESGNVELQTEVLRQALAVLRVEGPAPVVVDYVPAPVPVGV